MTPEKFFNIFVLCLLWIEDVHSKNKWTTVDYVTRVLIIMGLIDEDHRKVLYLDPRVQKIFVKNLVILPTHSTICKDTFSKKFVDKLNESGILSLANHDPSKNINRRRMLRDYKFSLTTKGKRYAAGLLEQKLLSQMEFLQAMEKANLEKEGIIFAMKQYRNRVERETEEGV